MPVFLEACLSAACPMISGDLMLTFRPILRRLPSVLVMYDMVVDGQLDRKQGKSSMGRSRKLSVELKPKSRIVTQDRALCTIPTASRKRQSQPPSWKLHLWRPRCRGQRSDVAASSLGRHEPYGCLFVCFLLLKAGGHVGEKRTEMCHKTAGVRSSGKPATAPRTCKDAMSPILNS
jgi:hypothetical protein